MMVHLQLTHYKHINNTTHFPYICGMDLAIFNTTEPVLMNVLDEKFILMSNAGLIEIKEKITTDIAVVVLTEAGKVLFAESIGIKHPYSGTVNNNISIGDGNKNLVLNNIQNSEDSSLFADNKSTIDLNKRTPQATFQNRISRIIGRIISFISCSIVIYFIIKAF